DKGDDKGGAKALARAEELIKKNETDQAVAVLEQVLLDQPTLSKAHRLLGDCLAQEGETDEAISHYKTFLEQAPNDSKASQVKASLKKLEAKAGDKPKGGDPTGGGAELSGSNALAAKVLQSLANNKPAEAEATLNKAIKDNPNDVIAHKLLA